MKTVLHTPKSAGEFLGGTKPISLRTLAHWRQCGIGPKFVRVGHAIRYPEDGLIAFLEKNKNA